MSQYPERALSEALAHTRQGAFVSTSGEYRLTGIYSFGKGLIARGSIQGSDTAYKTLTPLRTGQLVMSKLNAWEGALAVVTGDFDGTYVSPEYPVFDINEDAADPDYIRHLVSWPELWGRLTPRGSMVRRKRTTPETLLATTAPFPSRNEQQRIANKLNALLRRVDAVHELRSNLSRIQASLNEALVVRAAEDKAETVRLSDVLALERAPIDIEPEATYRTLGVRSFGKGFIHHPTTRGEDLSKLNYFRFSSGALALSNLMAWEGGITVTGPEDTKYIASNRFFFYMPTDNRVNVSYLRHYLLSRRGQALIATACSAGAERNRTLGRKRFEALEIPLPPRAEQDRVARTLDSLAERVSKTHSNPALDALRPSILNAAFVGRL